MEHLHAVCDGIEIMRMQKDSTVPISVSADESFDMIQVTRLSTSCCRWAKKQ